MQRASDPRRSRRPGAQRLTAKGLVGTVGVFAALLAALTAPVLVAGAAAGVVAAATAGRAAAAVRTLVPLGRRWLPVPLTGLSVRG